jgi:chitodextrinase
VLRGPGDPLLSPTVLLPVTVAAALVLEGPVAARWLGWRSLLAGSAVAAPVTRTRTSGDATGTGLRPPVGRQAVAGTGRSGSTTPPRCRHPEGCPGTPAPGAEADVSQRDGGPGKSRRRRGGWWLRLVVLGLLFGAVGLMGGSAPVRLPSPALQPVSVTDPLPPATVTVTGADRSLDVSWSPSTESFVTGYRIYLDDATTPAATSTTTSVVVPDLVNGRTYSVTVSTVTTFVGTEYEGTTRSTPEFGTPADSVAPAAPGDVQAARGDGRVTLTWTANAETDVDGYRVLRDGAPLTDLLPGAATVTYEDTAVVNDTTYGYTLQAHDTSGNWSVSSTPTASATPTDLTAPAVPAGFTATAGDGQVTLSWSGNGEPDLAGYVLERDGQQIAAPGAGDTGYVDSGLVNDTIYGYALVAVDGHGNRSGPATASATPTADAPPAAPTGVSAEPGDRQAVVAWSAVPEDDVVGYGVLDQDGVERATVAAPATRVTVTGLVNGQTYTFTVVAVDAFGNVSAPSAAVQVVPRPGAVPVEGAGETGGLAVSGNGRYVVIGSRARLEAADTNTAHELYLLDRMEQTARRIAPLPAAATSGDVTNAAAPAVSDDGRFIALATTAALNPADTNRLADVYRLDTQTGTWALVSVPAVGGKVSGTTPGAVLQTGPSVYATSPPVVVSADGDLVLFYSARPDLVAGDSNGAVDVFAKRMSTGAVTRVSATATGGNLPRIATGPALALTPDGRFAVFPAAAATGPTVLYRKTLSGAGAGTVTVVSSVLVSGRATEFSVYRDAGDVAVSDDGRYVALVTSAKLGTGTPTANWSTGLAYRVDTATGAVVAMGTGQTTVWEHQVELDPTGRYGFYSTTAAAVAGDTNGHTDHYRRDLDGGVPGPLVLATADADGRATTGPVGGIAPAEYGRLVAVDGDRVLVTTSQALLPDDANRVRDLYVKDVAGGAVGSPLG